MKGGKQGNSGGLWACLVADGLVFEPWFVQDHLQLFVIEIGHPNGHG